MCLTLLAAIFSVGLPNESNAQGTLYSYDVSGNLTVIAAGGIAVPQIVGQPQRQIVEPGQTATFSVVLANSQGATYQWRQNNNPIGGATKDALVLTNVTAANEGAYSVVVTNSSGTVTSASAALMIDSDRDGLGDSWEMQFFGNLTNTAAADFDNDTVSNQDEFLDGTDPTVAGSVRPRLTVLTDGGGTVTASPAKLSYAVGEIVTLTATAYSPNTFRGWSGDVTGLTNPTNVTMTTNKMVMGRFIGAPMPQGLISWWRAENNGQDAAGTNNGTLVNGATFAAGKVGQAFSLNGTNQSIDIPDSPSLRPTSLTLEAWVFPSDTSGVRLIFAKPLGAQSLDSFAVWINSGTLNAGVSDPFNFGVILSTSISAGAWHHVAFTYDGPTKQQALYLDGRIVGSGNAQRLIAYDASPVLLGRDIEGNNPAQFFAGQIDEAAIYNRALSTAEIQAIWAADIAGKSANQPYFTSPAELPEVLAGANYSQQLTAVFGTAPRSFFLSNGALPAGLNLSSTGLISGIPTIAGFYPFTVMVVDAAGQVDMQMLTLRVVQPVRVPSLVSWWRGQDNALDSAGTNHGTLENGATFADGKIGRAFSFDGTDDSVLMPTVNAGPKFSVELWLFPTGSVNGYQHLVSNAYNNTTNFGALYFLNNHVEYWHSGSPQAISPTGSIPLNKWSHVVLTHDGGFDRLYINGSLVATSSAGHVETFNTPLRLGYGITPSDNHFQGLLDEVSVYSHDLNADDVSTLYLAGSAGKLLAGPYLNTYGTLPDAVINQPYNQTISAVRGTPPINYTMVGGALPAGVNLSSAGVLSGTPTTSGAFNFTVRATDSANLFTEQTFSFRVYVPTPPVGGVVSWWRAENNAQDSIGTNHGTLINGTIFAAGEVGQAFAFNGTNQSFEVPDSPSLRPASVTLEGWVMFNSTTGIQAIFSKPLGAGFLNSYAVWWDFGILKAIVSDNAGGVNLAYNFVPTLGRWYHIAYTFDDATKQQVLYLDGVSVASGITTKSIAYDAQPFLLGRDIDNGSPALFFPGRIDEAAIYNRPLTATEIGLIASAGPAGRISTGPYFNTPSTLPDAVALTAYTQTLSTLRGNGQTTFSLVGGALPAGLMLNSSGLLSGTPTVPGSYSFVVRGTDTSNAKVDQTFSLNVLPKVSPPPGIAAWWRAETNAQDSIGTNHGTLINGATFSAGKVNQAFLVNGTNQYVSVPDSSALRPTSVTVEAWVNFSSNASSQAILAKRVGAIWDSYALWFESNALKGAISDINGGSTPISAAFIPVIGRWYHLAFTFDNLTKEQWLYIDGAAVATGISNRSIGYEVSPVLLGADIKNGNTVWIFGGRIDEAALYNRALSAAEIALLASAGSAGKTATGPYINTPLPLADGAVNRSYNQTITSQRGNGTVTYSLVNGALPPGLMLSSAGLLTGTPTAAGDFNFVVRATDSGGLFGDLPFTLHIYSPARFPLGLVSWWRAENNEQDSFGSNHGALLNGAGFAPGKVGQAFTFDGIDDHFNVPDSASLRPASVSIEAWVQFNNVSFGLKKIVSKSLGVNGFDSYAIWWDSNVLRGAVGDLNGFGTVIETNLTPAIGRWYHVAYTFDGVTKQQALYLDGLLAAIGQSNKSPAYNSQPLYIATDFGSGVLTYFFPGQIDEAAVYNRAITGQEINAVYNARAGGKRPLVSIENWKLANLGDPDALDSGDPEKDGLPNLLEYTFSTNPNIPNLAPAVTTQINGDGTRHLVVSFTRDPAKNDITITVQSSSDLQNWTAIATSTNGGAFTGAATITGEVAGTAPRVVTIVDPNSGPKRFLRVGVSH